MAEPRVVVVGGGPAGIRAAEALAGAGLRPMLVDEGSMTGGQIYRRQPPGFTRPPEKLYGTEAGRATALHAAWDRLRPGIDYWPDTLAWGIYDDTLFLARDGQAHEARFDALLIAAGATDRLLPLPGWTLPGVYSLGGSQIALKAQAAAIGGRIVFLGSGPLLYLVAAQYVAAGATVAAVLDTSTLGDRLAGLAMMAARPDVLAKGAGLMWRLRRAGVRIVTGAVPLRILGDDTTGVSGVVYRRGEGAEQTISADAVGMGWHLRAESQLADLAGCDFAFDPVARQWLPRIDQDGRASVRGIYLAGDGVRLQGADGAEASGRLAALAVLEDLGFAVPGGERVALRRTMVQMERFRRGVARAFPWPAALAAVQPDETLVCRCEAITAGTLRGAGTGLGAPEVNRAKAFSRLGMGRCQGRFCGLAGAEILAAARGCAIEQAGRLRGAAPVKPLPVTTTLAEGS